ncbi:FHA domain-containing protein [Microseira wollei]|uniref:FHA domain-containing protein n=1 Tax=Microseira wollei NIES-4236 TaxID=2530354 RepID=A0AAV3XDM8_9CYAN|nr:FHA domain-containing protein [Microseira wollei]GET39511.1 FHA domain-containing protein [Microseira wollei NIES-4236]
MIVCPNCNHQNPDGAVQCEACYTPLPATTSCPNCGTSVQTDASFCGQCGFDLRPGGSITGAAETVAAAIPTVAPTAQVPLPDLVAPDPLVQPDSVSMSSPLPDPQPPSTSPPAPARVTPPPMAPESEPIPSSNVPTVAPPSFAFGGKTQLQQQTAGLLHVQTQKTIELPQNLSIIHLGKPNDQIPPDIDVSGFPHSEIVSRVHADIRVEGDSYYIEDVGSANGTYINHTPLPTGNRHRLRPGDRISLGKGDLVTFLFQLS